MKELFKAAEMTEGVTLDVASGCAVVFSRKAPDKSEDKTNQDSAAVLTVAKGCVLVVADGAGGLPSGARASALAVDALGTALTQDNEDTLRAKILNGFERANTAVQELGVGAGTTLAVVGIEESVLRPYHVGDSSILVVGQRGKKKLITVSHSPVGYQVEAGVLDHKDALHHEDLAEVSNLVGFSDMRIEVGAPLELAPYDTVVIGSDGLFDNMHLGEISDRVRTGPLDKAAIELVELCLKRMTAPEKDQPSKPDDLTFVIFRRSDLPPRTPSRRGSASK